MITPFTEDNKIDYTAVQGIIDWYADHQVTGIFAVCQSSEMFFLSKEERYELAKYVIDHGHEKGMGVVVSGKAGQYKSFRPGIPLFVPSLQRKEAPP